MFKHVLVPLDGSLRAERALPLAARIVRVTGGSITLLRVVTTPDEYDTIPRKRVRRAAHPVSGWWRRTPDLASAW